MPDTNLGTAHGSIKIDYDSRAATQALAQLVKMQRQFETMNTRMASMQKSLDSVDRTIQQSTRSFDRMSKSLKDGASSGDSMVKSFRSMRRDIAATTLEVIALSRGLEKVIQYRRPLQDITKFLSGFAAGGQGLSGLSRGLSEINARSRFLPILASNMLGVNRAMKDMPRWSQETLRYATYLRGLAPIAAIASARLSGPLAKGMSSLNKTFALAGASSTAFLNSISRFSALRPVADSLLRAKDAVGKFSDSAGSLGRAVRLISQDFSNLPRQITGFIGGLALMRAGLRGLGNDLFITKFTNFFNNLPGWGKVGATVIGIFGGAIVQVFGKALTATSNLIAGLWAGIQQLSGGILAIPSAFSVVGAAAAVLGVGLSGLKDKFKDLGKDGADGLKALLELPDRLQKIGRAVYDVIPQLKEFRDSIQDILIAGADKQIYGLVDFANALKGSMQGTANSLRFAKDQILSFIGEGRTVSDLNGLFNRTAQIINTLAAALKPALSGLRDIGISGLPFIQELATQFQLLTGRFQEWAKANRDSGQFLRWMQDGYKGMRDLVRGTVDLTKALFSLLTIFRTKNEDNFLENYAKSMKKFNDSVQKSLAVGTLHNIAQAIKNIGTDKLANARDMAKFLGQAFMDVYPAIKTFIAAFNQVLIPVVKLVVDEFTSMAKIMHSLGLDKIIGWVLNLAAAFKFLPIIFGPLINSIKLMWGAFLLLSNGPKIARAFETAILAVGAALENFGSAGKKVGGVVTTIGSSMSGFIGSAATMAGPITAAIAAIAGMIFIWKSASDDSKAFEAQLKSNQNTINGFSIKLREAFLEDRGIVGKNVIRQLNENIQSELTQLEQTSQKAPGILDHIWGWANQIGGFGDLFKENNTTNQWQKQAADAGRAAEGLKKLAGSGKDVGKMLAESDDAWKSDTDAIKAWSENGPETVAILQKMRDGFKETERNARALGPAGAEVASGLKKISDAGSDATSKLEGLKQVLRGLGLLKTDQLQAAAEYADAIRKLQQSASDAIQGIDTSNILDKAGNIDVTTAAGKALLDVLVPIADKFHAMAVNGGDVDKLLADLSPQLDGVASQFGIGRDKLDAFLKILGIVPKEVKITVTPVADQTQNDLKNVLLNMQAELDKGDNTLQIPVGIATSSQDISSKINQFLGRNATSADGTNLIIKPGISQEDVNKLSQQLAALGIPLPGQTASPVPMPISPQVTAPQGPGQAQAQTDPQKAFSDLFGPVFDHTAGQAKTGGDAFSDNFAAGILAGKGKVDDAAKQVAQAAADHMPHSPAKKGPLSGQGWSGVSGRAFTSDFATGIGANTGQVTQAAGGVAGAAAGGLAGGLPPGLGGQVPGTKAGAFLGQLTQLVDFFSHLSDAFQKVADTALKVAKFASDPLGKGTFFGQGMGWVKTASEAEVRRRQGDMLQNKALNIFDSPKVSDQYDPSTGYQKIPAGQIPRKASKDEVIRGMVAYGQQAGLTPEQIKAMIATSGNETGGKFDPGIVGVGQGAFLPGGGKEDAFGLFQQSNSWGTPEQRTDPNYAINKFIERYKQVLAANPGIDPLTAATLTQNPQLGSGAAGSDYQNTSKRFLSDAAKSYADAVTAPAQTNQNGPTVMPVGPNGAPVVGTPNAPAGQQPIFSAEGPQFYDQAFGRNKAFAKPSSTNYQTQLNPAEEQQFRDWVSKNNVPFNPNDKNVDYDMRGYWRAMMQGSAPKWAGKDSHFPDTFKTPYDTTFSAESQYATPDNPFKWQGDNLVDTRTGQLVFGTPSTAPTSTQTPATSPTSAVPNVPQGFTPVPYGLPGGTDTKGYGNGTSATFPPWLMALAQQFNLKPSTYGGHQEDINKNGQPYNRNEPGYAPNPQHQNRGVDFIGSTGDMERFAQYLMSLGGKVPGLEQVIFRNPQTGKEYGFGGGKDVSGQYYPQTGDGSYQEHQNHLHARFSTSVPLLGQTAPDISQSFGTPPLPGQKPSQPDVAVQQDANGNWILVTPHTGDAKMPGPINPATKQPWTEQEAKDFYSRYLQYNAGDVTPGQLQQIQNTPGLFPGSTQDLINAQNNPALNAALGLKDTTNASDNQVLDALNTIQKTIDQQNNIDTPESRALVKTLQSTQSTIAQQYGFQQQQNPIDTASSVIGSMGSAASDIFGAIQAGIESVGAAKNIADTLVRGVSNTEDIYNMVDQVQTFITFASKIAGAVQGVAGAIGAVAGAAGGADPTGGASGAATAIQGVSAIAGIVQSALDTANAIIDLGQEAYRIVGSYVGDFLGYLAGGAGGQLTGNVKFLLDQRTGELLTYSQDNPLDKRSHNAPGYNHNPSVRDQSIGQINVYGGPNSDPRDNTRNMMFQVRVAQYTGALAS